MRAIIWVALACVVAAGCTSEPPDDRGSTSSVPPSPAPVTRSLDPSAYATEDTVCGLLTDEQAVELGLQSESRPHKRGDTVFSCEWKLHGDDLFQIEYDLALNTDLLGEWYAAGDDLQLRDVEGQPAGVLDGANGVCKVAVRLAEKKSLHVSVADMESEIGCALAVPMAEQIVRNLKG